MRTGRFAWPFASFGSFVLLVMDSVYMGNARIYFEPDLSTICQVAMNILSMTTVLEHEALPESRLVRPCEQQQAQTP